MKHVWQKVKAHYNASLIYVQVTHTQKVVLALYSFALPRWIHADTSVAIRRSIARILPWRKVCYTPHVRLHVCYKHTTVG